MPVSRLLRGGARAELAGGHAYSKRARTNMANNPKKVKDPTEVALSAIQEALNIGDSANNDSDNDRDRDSMRSESARSEAPPPIAPPPVYNEPSFEVREPRQSAPERPVFDPIEEPRQTRRAANDDRET